MRLRFRTSFAWVIAVALLAGCGEKDETVPVTPTPPVGRDAADARAADEGRRPDRLVLSHPPGTHPIIWLRRGAEVPVHTEPGGGDVAYVARKRTEWGSPSVFGIVKRVGEWAAVSTPERPNGALGWVPLDPQRLRAGWSESEIQVDLSARRAVLRERGEVVRAFPVTVGAPGHDTPTGRFAVTDTFRGDLNEAYGCCALALSATQPNVPSGWFGGNRIAIHGTYGPLGVAASNGCVRAANGDVRLLVKRIALGTPVVIGA